MARDHYWRYGIKEIHDFQGLFRISASLDFFYEISFRSNILPSSCSLIISGLVTLETMLKVSTLVVF